MASVIIRGYIDGELEFEDTVFGADQVSEDQIRTIAARHLHILRGKPHMIELEFPDEPDPNNRFCRFGTDPSCMVNPAVLWGNNATKQ